MKTVMALYGPAQTGKSSSIKIFYELLKSEYPHLTMEKMVEGGDIVIILVIGKARIGIESQGDPNSRLFTSLPEFVEAACDLIVCATRTRGGTVEAVNSLSSLGYDIRWYSPEQASSPSYEREANERTARILLRAIKDALGN